jgi:hypothetical protein
VQDFSGLSSPIGSLIGKNSYYIVFIIVEKTSLGRQPIVDEESIDYFKSSFLSFLPLYISH